MKFFVALAVIALASVASGRGLDLVFGGAPSYTNVLAREIAPLLLQRQPLLKYNALPLAATQTVVQSAPQIFAVPLQASYLQAAAPAPGPINAAVLSRRNVQIVDVPSSGGAAPVQSIIIGPSTQPLDLEFQSQSSPISVRQVHIPGQANPPQFSSHTDQPDLLKQEIIKPIIHEVTEAIQPFRKITQEVRPVQETINQVITRGQNVQTVPAVAAAQVAVAAPVAIAAQVAAPVAVAEAPLAAVAGNILAAPAAQATVLQAAPIEVQAISGPFTAFDGQLQQRVRRALPVGARISRF